MVSYNYNGEYVLISKWQYNDSDNCIVWTKNSDLKISAIGTLAKALMLLFLSAALILGTAPSASAIGGVGTMTVTPTSSYSGSTGNSFNFEFNSDSYTFSNGRLYITIPSGWTAPTMSPGDGHVAITLGTCSGASLNSVNGMTVRINNINCNPSQTFTLTYSGVTAPVSTGIYTFTTLTNSAQTGGVTSIGTSPTVTVNNLLPTTTSISPNSKNVGDAGFTMTVTGTNFVSGSEVRFDGAYRTTTYVSNTSLNATIPASDMLTSGTYSITVFNPTPGGGTSNPQTFTVNTVSKLNQDITFDTLEDKTYGDSDFTIAATASSGLTVSFAASGDCTVSVNTVHIIGAGSCTMTASQDGNDTYNPATDVDQIFSIAKANPTISVTPYSVTYDGNPHTATGTATGINSEILSGLDLSGTTHSNAGNYPSDAWTFTDVTGNYNDTSGIVSDSIAKADATIVITPYSVTYDGNSHTATGTATGINSEILSGLDLGGTTHTDAGTYSADAWTFTDVTGNYNDTSGSVSDSIAKATPTITWSTPADIKVGTPLSITQFNAAANVAGTYVYTPPAGTVLSAGAGQTLHVDFTPTDTANYNTESKDVTINVVEKEIPSIIWNNPADITYGTALDGTQLNAAASVAGTYVYTPAAGTLLGAGAGRALHVDFTPTDTVNYSLASKDVTINVNQATPIITWNNPADITYGTPLGPTQLNAAASVPGSFVYNPASGIVLNPGEGQTLHADFTPTDTTNYTVASMDVTINVTGTLPTTRYINGTITDSGSHLPLAGVTVSITGGSLPVVTDGTGNYSFAVADGSYTITATLFDIRYYTYSASVDTNGVPSVTHDIELQLKPTGTISGNITVK